jgi:hypothetical protein
MQIWVGLCPGQVNEVVSTKSFMTNFEILAKKCQKTIFWPFWPYLQRETAADGKGLGLF